MLLQAHFRAGQGYLAVREWEDALRHLTRASKLDTQDGGIKAALAQVHRLVLKLLEE